MASRKYLQYKEKNERSAFSVGMVFKDESSNVDQEPPAGQSLLATDVVTAVPPPSPTPSNRARTSFEATSPCSPVVPAATVTQAASSPAAGIRTGSSGEQTQNVLAVQGLTLIDDDRMGQHQRSLSASPQKGPLFQQQVSTSPNSMLSAPVGHWIFCDEPVLVRSGPWAVSSMRPQDEGQIGNWYFLEPMDKAKGVHKF